MPASEAPTMSPGKSVAMSPAGQRAAQKLDALRQVQSQAEHRVKIGTQLLKAAEAHTQHTRSYLEDVRAEQNELREKLEKDVAAALHQYDQWVGTIDENLTRRLEKIESRLDAVEKHWQDVESRVLRMVRRSEALMDKSRAIMEVVAEYEEESASPQATPASAGPSKPAPEKSATLPIPIDPPPIAPAPPGPHAPPVASAKPDTAKPQAPKQPPTEPLVPVINPMTIGKKKQPKNLYQRLIQDLNRG